MEDKQKVEEVKKVLKNFEKFENYSMRFYIRIIKNIDKVVNDKNVKD